MINNEKKDKYWEVIARYGLLIFIVFQSCRANNEPECCSPNEFGVQTREFPFDTINPLEKWDASKIFCEVNGPSSFYKNFGFHFFAKNTEPHVAYMNAAKDSLIIISLSTNRVYKQILIGKSRTTARYSGFISDSLFHMVVFKRQDGNEQIIYYKYKIDDTLRIQKIDSINITVLMGENRYVIHTALEVEKVSTYLHPYLIFSYGKPGPRFVNTKKAVVLVNTETRSIKEVISHPESYYRCSYYPAPFVMLLPEGKSEFLYAFCKSDGLYKYSTKQLGTIDYGLGQFKSERLCFDRSKNENLAYLRKYSLTDETNVNLLSCGGKYYLVKRKVRNKESDPEHCLLLEFNKDLKHTRTFFLKEPCSAYMSFTYRMGIAFFNSAEQKIHYYRIP